MAGIATQRILAKAQTGARRDLIEVLTRAASQVRGILLAAAGADGKIPLRSLDEVQRQAGEIVLRTFVGPDLRRPFGKDGVTALAPIPDLLNRWLAWETYAIVRQHQQYMRARLPDDVFSWLKTQHRRVQELSRTDDLKRIADQLRIFDPNPLAQYDAPHTWLDPRGYRLSDRIWRTGTRTRDQIDALLADGIRRGLAAVTLADLAERFLRPDRAPLRTTKPYGTDGSFDALRLVRSEITRAHSQASLVSAQMNPFVESMTWNTSGSHPLSDICDSLAASSPYPLTAYVPLPVQDSHPNCLCYMTSNVRAASEVIAELRAMMEDAESDVLPYVTPADLDAFVAELLGDILLQLARQMVTFLEAAA